MGAARKGHQRRKGRVAPARSNRRSSSSFATYWLNGCTLTDWDSVCALTPGRWASHNLHDVDLHSWARRLRLLQGQIIKRGHFNRKAAERALVDHSAKSKEEVARWLRDELRVLRRPRVSAPVRNNISLSRLFISDVAITMLQFLKRAPGENLICLLQELLEVDRHRRKESEFQGETYAHALRVAALKSLQGVKFGVRDQARFVGVDPSTITRWRRSTGYSEGVQALGAVALCVGI